MAICNGCNLNFDDSFNFCTHCGTPKHQEKKIVLDPVNGVACLACGSFNMEAQNFCQKCGKSLCRICMQCGHKNKGAVEFCGGCGIRLAEAKFTLTYDTAETWMQKFWVHPGVKTFFASGGFAETKFYPYAAKITEMLKDDPFPVTHGEDHWVIAFPITDQNWCVASLLHKFGEIKNGLVVFWRNQLRVYNFHKNSRTVYLYNDLNDYDQDRNAVTLYFTNEISVLINFKVPTPSRASANAITALGFLGSVLSDTIVDKSPAERRIDDLRDEVRRANPNYVSASDKAHSDYWSNFEASNTYVPLFCSFIDTILKNKKRLNNG